MKKVIVYALVAVLAVVVAVNIIDSNDEVTIYDYNAKENSWSVKTDK